MTRKWSESPSFFIRQPWTGRADLRTERAAELAKEWLRRKKGPVVAGSEAINTALCAIEELKKIHQYLRVAIVVPSRTIIYKWSEKIQEFFGFPERVVGLVDGERSDYFSKWTRILVCTADPGLNLLAEKCDSFIGRDLLLIGHELSHSQLHALQAVPHAYSLILLENDAELTVHDYYGRADEDSEPVGPLNEESAVAVTSATQLLNCTNLQDSDAYFSAMLTKDMLIGDIEISEEELDHLANLISAELKKPVPQIKSSLSIAVFLVWAGIRYYQEGNYWAPIYEKLGLPLSNSKWQAILGNVFLDVIQNKGLLEMRDGQTYVTPILAHGYVPDYYLESFFNDFLWPTYLKRINSGLSVSLPEVEHQISTWRLDFREYEDLHERLAKLAEEERTLSIKLEALRNKEKVRRYEVLARRVQESELLDKVLSFPAKWLDWAREVEKGQQYAIAEKAREFKESAERLAGKLNSIKLQIEETGNVLFSNWTFSQCENVAALPIEDIQKIITQYQNGLSRFSGPLGWILRVLMAKRYKSVHKLRDKIDEAWQPLTLKEEYKDLTVVGTAIINNLVRLQELIAEWTELQSELEESHLPQLEAGATLDALNEEEHIRARVADMDREMESFIALLIDLGQGNIEAGCKLAEAQREVRAEIKELRESIPIDINTLLACLPEAEKYTEEEINDSLLLVRKDKRACTEALRFCQNALYFLNESTRAFIFQGREKAATFVHAAFQYLHSLESGISQPQSTNMLPVRIAQAMQKWWAEMERSSTEGSGWPGWEKGKQQEGRIRKPTVCFDAEKRIVKVCLPSALVQFESDGEVDRANFEAWGDASLIFQEQLPLFREAGKTYRTGALEKNLNSPQPVYKFKFSCGVIEREWKFDGPGSLNKSIMFNADGMLVENTTEYNIFPGDYAWVIAPAGSVVEPSVAERERDALIGDWSGYEAIYVDLCNIDVLIIRSGDVIDVYRRQARIEPAFIGGEGIPGVTGQDGAPVYASGLPGLVFSVKHHYELTLYGIKIKIGGKEFYMPAKELQPLLSRDNAVLIELGNIFANYYGEFTVVLARRNKKIWECKCVVLPDLKIAWQRPVYYLAEENAPMSKLTISSVLPFIFTGQAGTVRNYSHSQTILFDTSQSVVSGTAVFSLGENTYARASLVIDIPCIRWRWANEKLWRFKAEEVWYRDVGEIAVKVPKGWNSVSLSLKESRQKITKPVKNGIAVFDLSKFADSLRLGKQDLQELIIESDGLAPSVLMRIRTKWLVDKVEFEDREEAGQRIVNIRWTELGKAENRVIRLWPLDRGGTTVYEYPLPDNVYSYVITEGTDKLRPGKYWLQFEEVDLWSSGKALFPKESSRNCIELQLGEIIDLTGIKWRLVETQKWLDIPGRLWYKRLGQIELLMPDDVRGDSAYIFGEGCRVALEHIEGQKYIADCTKFIAEVANCSAHPYKIKMAVSGLHFEFLEVFSEWEVYDIESRVFRDGDKWEFFVSWNETCNATRRIIRIWSGDFQECKEWTIPDGEETKVIIREPLQDFSAGRYILQFAIQGSSSSLPGKPKLDGKNEGYIDIPHRSGRASLPEKKGKLKAHKNPVIPEYKCPKHNIILPIGTRKCSYCDYKVEKHAKIISGPVRRY